MEGEDVEHTAVQESHRLWISDTWYIPVGDTGLCEGPCLEGALGCVVQLRSKDKRRLALKLPRLMGETHRENSYINDLMEKELHAVLEVFFNEMSISDGLLPANTWEERGPMRGQVHTRMGPPEAQKLDGAIVLVNFEKGRKPRFCTVKKVIPDKAGGDPAHYEAGGSIEVFPETIRDCPVSDADIFDRVEECAFNGNENNSEGIRPWDRTVFIEHRKAANSGGKPLILSKDEAIQFPSTGETWYACVPSVAYLWAPGTLQEAISLNKRGKDWGVSQHFSLAKRICMGIYALHRNHMLHADLRPANIAYRGDATKPDHYYVCDYGSFAEIGARVSERNPTGETVLGPVAGTERSSVFYAPERRAGREREAADTAVIINPGGATLNIVLGWQSDLDDVQAIIKKARLLSDGSAPEQPRRGKGSMPLNSLLKGDRIQIRDYIFDIIDATEVEGKQVLRCQARSWKIYQGRIVVENTECFDAEHWLPIPRTVELQQWSAATDLYSLGALLLYSVYRSEKPGLQEGGSAVEEKFREMLSYLESEPYFNNIWPELESLVEQLEESLTGDTVLAPDEFGNQPFNTRKAPDGRIKKADEKSYTLKTKTVDVVQRITQTVPWSKRLVRVFDFNLGPFILFVHFVLCCLHRRSHLQGTEEWKEKPFCADRCEPPKEDGGAMLALERLEVISALILDRRLTALKADPNDIPDFDPRPEPLIRASYNFLWDEASNIARTGRQLTREEGLMKKVRAPFYMNRLDQLFSDLEQAVQKSTRYQATKSLEDPGSVTRDGQEGEE